MTYDPRAYRVDNLGTMDHAKGAWPGMRPCWWKITHIETGLSVTWHDHADGMVQWKARDTAQACLDLLIESLAPRPLPQAQENDNG